MGYVAPGPPPYDRCGQQQRECQSHSHRPERSSKMRACTKHARYQKPYGPDATGNQQGYEPKDKQKPSKKASLPPSWIHVVQATEAFRVIAPRLPRWGIVRHPARRAVLVFVFHSYTSSVNL